MKPPYSAMVVVVLGAFLLFSVLVSPSAHAQMGAATVSVTCSPPSVVVGSSTTCIATVIGIASTPTGSVTWSSSGGGTFSPSPTASLVSGTSSVSYTPSSSSSPVTITATYGGDVNNEGSMGLFSLRVALASSSVTTTSTTATTPEFPVASIAVIMLVVLTAAALISRRIPHAKIA